MDVFLDRQPEKYIRRMNEPDLSRVLDGLSKLSREPPEGDIKKLTDCDGYRLRVGTYRILFHKEADRVIVSKIAARGQAYQE